jgi:hypothetical protein
MKALVMARRRHVVREMKRVEIAKAMKRSRGIPSKTIWVTRNVCWAVSVVQLFRMLRSSRQAWGCGWRKRGAP